MTLEDSIKNAFFNTLDHLDEGMDRGQAQQEFAANVMRYIATDRLAANGAVAVDRDAMNRAWQKCCGPIIESLAKMVRTGAPDDQIDRDLVYRTPIMGEVVRIRQTVDAFSKVLRAALSASPAQSVQVADEGAGWIDPAKRDDESLVEVCMQLYARACAYSTQKQHDDAMACKRELLRRLSTPRPRPADGAQAVEAVAWLHDVVQDDGENDQALSFSPDSFPLEGVGGFKSTRARPLSFRDAYEGARDDLLDWKGRALRAEKRLRAEGWQGIDASSPSPAAPGNEFVLVPARFGIPAEAWEAASFAFGGPATGEGEAYMDCTAWIGNVEQDDGTPLYGLHVSCDECPEEGSITLAELPAAPGAKAAEGG